MEFHTDTVNRTGLGVSRSAREATVLLRKAALDSVLLRVWSLGGMWFWKRSNRSGGNAGRPATSHRQRRAWQASSRSLPGNFAFVWFRNQTARFIVILGLCFSVGCVRERNPVTGQTQFYGSSWQQELAMGREANQQILQQYGLYQDSELQAYVERVGQRVLAESDLRQPSTPAVYRQTPIKFQVLDSPVVNALAVPGYVYVTRGLLSHLENEAQLAVVLGHGIGHLAARHISEQTLQQQFAQLGLVAGAIVGTQVLENPEVANQLK